MTASRLRVGLLLTLLLGTGCKKTTRHATDEQVRRHFAEHRAAFEELREKLASEPRLFALDPEAISWIDKEGVGGCGTDGGPRFDKDARECWHNNEAPLTREALAKIGVTTDYAALMRETQVKQALSRKDHAMFTLSYAATSMATGSTLDLEWFREGAKPLQDPQPIVEDTAKAVRLASSGHFYARVTDNWFIKFEWSGSDTLR
jgi:hypothetical protein